ncbi:MAG: tetratricopeptide repeat protein [Burkholderiaceae bacterium]
MGARKFRVSVQCVRALLVWLVASMGLSHAAGSPGAKPENSSLDSQLFYQLLIGEIELRNGQAGTAYEVLLDAARRTKDEQLFRRATDIALEARAMEQALGAAKAWRSAVPESLQAHRYVVQLLVSLNRAGETAEPLRSMLSRANSTDRVALINSLPRFFGTNADRRQTAVLIEQVLLPYLKLPETQVVARVATARAWFAAQETAKALELTRAAHALDATAEGPAVLAIEMLTTLDAAQEIVQSHLAAKPDSNGVRLVYVRALAGLQRYAEAVELLQISTRNQPELAPPWLTLGALQLELKHPAEAAQALKTYVQLVEGSAGEGAPASAAEDEGAPANRGQGLTQAWLLLAQSAEQMGDYTAAEAWLAKIDNPQRALEVQTRRAAVLARQGKFAQARELVRQVPERAPEDARAKLLAEAQVLRDVKRWGDANAVLAQANQRFENDPDLLYEQSMTAEKLDRMDDMERLLRRVIEIKPDHHHAYNALGYSLADRNQRLPEAKSLIQKALALSPGEPFITDSLGWVEFRLGNRDEALRLLRGAYKSRPDPEIAAHLGEVLWSMGQKDEARRIWREGQQRDKANDVLRETLGRLRVDL